MHRAISSSVPKSFNVQEFIQSSVMSWLHCPLHDPSHGKLVAAAFAALAPAIFIVTAICAVESNDRTRSLSSIWLNARAAAQSCFSATSMEERKRCDLSRTLCLCVYFSVDLTMWAQCFACSPRTATFCARTYVV